MESSNKRKANVFINPIRPDKENTEKSNVEHNTHSKSTKRRPLTTNVDLNFLNPSSTINSVGVSLSTNVDVNFLNPSSRSHYVDVLTMQPPARAPLIDITNSK